MKEKEGEERRRRKERGEERRNHPRDCEGEEEDESRENGFHERPPKRI